MTEKMVKAILRVTHGWNPQETPGSILISDEVQPIFTGITFKLADFPQLRQGELRDRIVEADGELVLSDQGVTVDYLIVPTRGLNPHQLLAISFPHTQLVSDLWVEDCLDSGQLLPVKYHHRAVEQILEQPLKGVVACLSGYLGRERKFLSELVVALGGVSQEIFAKRDKPETNALCSTHLVCLEAEGSKFNAARKWKVTAVTKDWLLACLREKCRVSEKEFLVGEAQTTGNQAPDEVPNMEELEVVSNDSPVLVNLAGNGNEEEVAKIADQASKKMKLEVDAKVKEMESLKLQREAAVQNAKLISAGIEKSQKFVDHEREILGRHEKDEESDKKIVAKLNSQQQRIQEVKEEIMRGQARRQKVVRRHQGNLKSLEEKNRMLKEGLEKTNSNVKKLEKNLADLPSAHGFSEDYVSLLDEQIATRRKELECPVCLEEAAPPIYSCVAQHLVCGKCRIRMEQCGVCRVPYHQQLLRHRYAEKDHQQLMDLCRQRDALRQKLTKRSHMEMEV